MASGIRQTAPACMSDDSTGNLITSRPQVDNYFHQIPHFKVPRKGSTGESYRKLQIAYQIPDQDIDLKHCLYIESKFVDRFYEIAELRSREGLDVASVQPVHVHDGECVSFHSPAAFQQYDQSSQTLKRCTMRRRESKPLEWK